MFVNEFVAYSELGKMIEFREKIIEMNLFESYHNGSISIPKEIGIMIWNVLKLTTLKLLNKDFLIRIL